jgi:predicted RNase H-like nuclease
MSRRYTGVDGCRGGWFAVTVRADGDGAGAGGLGRGAPQNFETTLFPLHDHSMFEKLCEHSELVLIDIPIGLPDNGEERKSDRLVRQALGKRGGSIFPVPSREAVYAETYAAACEINVAQQGKKISKQTWNLVPKIKDIDRFLQRCPHCSEVLRESSPEYAFQILAGGPLEHKKSDPRGIEERLDLCTKHLPGAREPFGQVVARYPRKSCAPHDILDALVLAFTAMLAEKGGKREVPEKQKRDRFGIPIQAVFAE